MIFWVKYVKVRLFLATLFFCMCGGSFVNAHDMGVVPHLLEKSDTYVNDIDISKYADMEKSGATAHGITLAIYADLSTSDLSNLAFCQQMTEKLNAYPMPKNVVRTKAIFLEFCRANHLIKHPIKDNPHSPFYAGEKKKPKKMEYPKKENVGEDVKSPMPIIKFKTAQDQRAHLERQRVVSEQLIARDQALGRPRLPRNQKAGAKSSPVVRKSAVGKYVQHLESERIAVEPNLAPDQSISVFSDHSEQNSGSLENAQTPADNISPPRQVALPRKAEFKRNIRQEKLKRQMAERSALDSASTRGDE